MSNIDKHGLLGVPKHANQHRLSRLTMEVHTDELRIMASEVESYTDELIAALEAAEKRIADLEAREVTLPVNITSANAPEVFEIAAEAERLGLRGTYASYAVGWNARGMADKEALREAGVNVAAAGKGD
ncbi:hypothetical protein ACTVDX_001532 [Enterobacter hormaechei]